jgi:hypothetical protein
MLMDVLQQTQEQASEFVQELLVAVLVVWIRA